MFAKAAVVVLVLVLLGLFTRPPANALPPSPSYIVSGTPDTTIANPAQNLRIFCVTDKPYGPPYTPAPIVTYATSVKPNDSTGTQPGANVTGINQAITDCIVAGGGVVYFPPGIYYVNGTINVPPSVTVLGTPYKNNGVILMGAGAETTGIYAVSGFTTSTSPIDTALVSIGTQAAAGGTHGSTPINNCWVRDMSLQTVYTGANVTNVDTVLEFSNAIRCGCENVHTTNSNNGIWFNGFGDCRLDHCRSVYPSNTVVGLGSGLRLNGFYTETTAMANAGTDLWVVGGCQFNSNTNGIDIMGSAGGVHIENADISNNTFGIVIEVPSSPTNYIYRNREIVIGHSAIDSNANVGILVKQNAAETLRMIGTWCSSNGLSAGDNGMQVNSPQITETTASGASPPIINLFAINMAGCRFSHNGGHGLSVSAAQSLNVTGSTFDFNGGIFGGSNPNGHGIYLPGTALLNSVITGNMLTKNGVFSGTSSSNVSGTYGAGLCIGVGVKNITATGNNTLGNLYTGGTGGTTVTWAGGGTFGQGVQLITTSGGPPGLTDRLLGAGSPGATPTYNLNQ